MRTKWLVASIVAIVLALALAGWGVRLDQRHREAERSRVALNAEVSDFYALAGSDRVANLPMPDAPQTSEAYGFAAVLTATGAVCGVIGLRRSATRD